MKLSNQRYEEIKLEISYFLEDYDVKQLPINVFEIARKMKIKLIFSSQLINKFPKKLNEYIVFGYPDSYLIYNPITQNFIIYIDDVGSSRKRQRFSLAHELMHIILGHTEQSTKNEIEANFGATYLLAPTSLTLIKSSSDKLLIPEIVSEIFDVSISEAEIIIRYNSNRLQINKLEATIYEQKINDLLRDALEVKLRRYN